MNIASRIFRRLARAFPHEFQIAYGADVMQLGEDVLRDMAGKHGTAGVVRLLADIATRLPLEYASEMRRDMRYAVRGLVKSRGFAFVGILSMGLGIALTTMVYSSKWQVITRELPAAANARRLVMPEKPASYYYVEQYRAEHTLFAGVAAFRIGVPFNVAFPGDSSGKPQRVFGQLVSADYFAVLGMRPQRGRLLDAGRDRPGDAPVVVISDRFWRNRLHSSPDVLGRTLRLNGQPATIVGITPRNFNGALAMTPAELFVPITVPAALAPELGDDVLHRRRAREFLALICLGPGVSIDSAEVGLDVITRRLDAEDASLPSAAVDTGRRVTLVPAGTMVPIPRDVRPAIAGLLAALMALIMAIACLNLANMLLARGLGRRKEVAIRLSVGASRFRLVRQMVSEGIVLSLVGGMAGFPIACVLAVLKSSVLPPTAVPQESNFMPDWQAAVFVFALAVVCGIGFSLVPALRATSTQISPALKDDSTLRLPGHRRVSLRNLLMVAQVGASVTLLLVTGFLVIGINNATLVRTRFDPHRLYLLSLDPIRDGYSAAKTQALFEALPERLTKEGPVRAVALAAQAPYGTDDEDSAIEVTAGESHGASRMQISAAANTVGAGYFAALGEPILAGRDFIEADQRIDTSASTALPVILSERAARGLFGNGNAIGRSVTHDNGSYDVVGVVPDLGNGAAVGPPVIYLPLTRHTFAQPPADGLIVMVRSDGGTDALSGIRRTIESVDPDLNIFNVQSLADYLDRTRSYNRFHAQTYGVIGLFGLVLAAIGLAGVTAYAVARRRREIGIRMALGAGKGRVVRLVLGEAVALVSVGTALGFICAFLLAKMLSALTSIFAETLKVSTNDPRLLVGAPVLLAALTLVACYLPAHRAARIDPLKALRQE